MAKSNIYALVKNNSNRAILLIDSQGLELVKQYLIAFDLIEVEQTSSATFNFSEGTITTTSIYPVGKPFSKDAYHLINKHPDDISLEKAYEILRQIKIIKEAIKDSKEILNKKTRIHGIALSGCETAYFNYFQLIDTPFIFNHLIEKLESQLSTLEKELESL